MQEVIVHLVRHGQSTWNVERRLQGQTAHPPLTDRGRADAARAARQLAALVGDEPVCLVTSDLERARQSAAIIADRLGVTAVEDVALREQHLGDMQGRLTSELSALPVPDGQHISEVRWGGGESIADVHARLTHWFGRQLRIAPQHLVVVTHGDTLRVARAVLHGRTHREVEWGVVPNGAVVSVRVG
ncbi:histidine phosphatase family protein [Blastococcus sp. Marseille-P5729]|uniref:histidine phosphatase family protein n=1 Tax=Blastococcus sp. Marseille-P5729 TaxID=2086582 RepID=UPI000D0F4C88|nr:histidine phosphatase family protein [Blastococcus sp. Marseille-P5729]